MELKVITLAAVLVTGCGAGAQGAAERGTAATADERWVEAFEAWDRAVPHAGGPLEPRRERVRAALHAGRLPELIERLEQQVEDDPSDARARYELALAVAAAGQPRSDREAIELLEAAAEQLGDEAEPYYRVGLLRLEQERFEQAVAPLERAVALAPRQVSHRVALAGALVELEGQGDRVRQVLGALPELEPTEAEVARARSVLATLNDPAARLPEALRGPFREAVMALSEDGDSVGEAVQLIEEALMVAPRAAPFLVLDGLASARLGQRGRARAAFTRATELAPGDPTPWVELAMLDEAVEDLSGAEEHLERAIEVAPLDVDAWAELGRVRYQQRRFDEAAEAFERLVAVDGGGLLSRLWLGRALRRAGRDAAAEEVYLTTLEEHPGNYEACLQLGHIYRRRRLRVTERRRSAALLHSARRYYEMALEIRPEDPLVQRMLETLEGTGGG